MKSANSVGNSVLLDYSTVGISCETDWNLTTMINYLEDKSNQLSFPDTNHNVKR